MRDRQAWLKKRQGGLGGSDSAAAAGLSKWKTPAQLYLEKTATEVVDEENEAMRRGTILEPAVRQMYADATGSLVYAPPDFIWANPVDYPWAYVNLDGVVGDWSASGIVEINEDTIIVECKTARSRYGWGEPGTDEIPIDYLCQVTHAMVCTGVKTAHVAVFFGDFDFQIYVVDFNPVFATELMEAERLFWQRVLDREPPEPSCAQDVERYYPRKNGAEKRDTAVFADHADLQIVADLLAIKKAKAELEAEEERCEAALKWRIGDNRSMVIQSTAGKMDFSGLETVTKPIVTWSNPGTRTGVDMDKLKLHPRILKEVSKTTTTARRFTVNLKGGEPCLPETNFKAEIPKLEWISLTTPEGWSPSQESEGSRPQ